MSVMNPYQVLELKSNAGKEEIRKAYRNLARKYHPDSNPDNPRAEEKFKQIHDAYVILSDENKKAAYDREMKQEKGGVEKPAARKQYQKEQAADFRSEFENANKRFNDFFGFKF